MNPNAIARRAKVTRETRETKVKVEIDIDGNGQVSGSVQEEFLRHMVETLGRYSGSDIAIDAEGDIDHHLVEDVAITLGHAYRKAMGDAPVVRIADATVPMDEALVHVVVDLIDRPFVDLEVPDQLYEHFIRSFAMELRATIHTRVLRGRDEHHILEATFKALGLALRRAMQPAPSTLSTKSSVKWGHS